MGRFVAGLILILLGFFCVGYIRIYEMFICGIVQVVDGFKADPTSAPDIAWGAAKVLIFNGLAWVGGWFLVGRGGKIWSQTR